MDITKANRDMNELDPLFAQRVQAWLNDCRGAIFIVEGYRSQERQDYLYASGRTRPGPILTMAKKSNHTLRKAVDIGFTGPALYPPATDGIWKRVADKAKKQGLFRGGDRDTKFRDLPHFSMING